MNLRNSGILATLVFLLMVASDLLMLSTLDFARPYRFWIDAPRLPDAQVTFGYFLGVLVVPFYTVGAWHLALAIRPAPRWVGRYLLLTTAYSAALLAVFHASFAFTRSILRVQSLSAGNEADLAFQTFARPLFLIACGVAAPVCVATLSLIVLGRSLYPRWAGVVLPAIAGLLAFPPAGSLPVWTMSLLGPARWNIAGAVVFATSTLILWNRDELDHR